MKPSEIVVGGRYARGTMRRSVESIRPGRLGGVVLYRVGHTSRLQECSLRTFAAWAEVRA